MSEIQNEHIIKSQEEYNNLVKEIVRELENKAIEREELIRIAVLAIFSRTNMFLIGEPGVGKTYLLNILISAVNGAKSFEYLIMAHTKPEELFGTSYVDQEGQMHYDIENSILDAHFVFLDEIFKGRSDILNTLLGITHPDRKYFMRGVGTFKVPMVCMFGASNEFPQNEALEALDDRFLFRYEVLPIQDMKNYERYIKGDYDKDPHLNVNVSLKDLEYAYKASKEIEIPEYIVKAYIAIREELIKYRVRLSDRKINLTLDILKVSAFLNNRKKVDFSDLFLIKHIMWRDFNEQENVKEVLKRVVFGTKNEIEAKIMEIKKEFEKNYGYIKNELAAFINKGDNVEATEVEKYYGIKIKDLDIVLNNLKILIEAINSIVRQKEFVDEVLEQIENNIFIFKEQQEVFDKKIINELSLLRMDITREYKRLIKFKEICPDAYSYMNYNPALLLT